MTRALAKPVRLPTDPPPSHTREAPTAYNLRVQLESLSFTGTELTFLANVDGGSQQDVLVHIMFNNQSLTRLDVGRTDGEVDLLIALLPEDYSETVITNALQNQSFALNEI